jgi:hypothetical protein
MAVRVNVPGAFPPGLGNAANDVRTHQFVLQSALSAYSHEAYTNAKKISSTAMIGDNPLIDTSTETYIGQTRWFKPMNPHINVASLTDPTPGTLSTYSSEFLKYVKTVRTYGGEKINLQHVITQQDGLAKISRDFGEHRAQDEHNALLSVLKGVAISEVLNGSGEGSGNTGLGGQTFDNDPADKRYGFYVDLGDKKLVGAASETSQGAQRAEGFLNAFGAAYKDYEPEYAYLVTSPEMMASLRSANLVDQDRVRDGNVEFNTIFQGKFRLIQTRANAGLTAAEITKLRTHGTAAAKITDGVKTSYIVLPGALAMRQLAIDEPTEIDRNASAYLGGGTTQIWYRWGYVIAPVGYDWNGSEGEFPSDTKYQYVKQATMKPVTGGGAVTDGLVEAVGTWQRKTASALSLGILPVFHS